MIGIILEIGQILFDSYLIIAADPEKVLPHIKNGFLKEIKNFNALICDLRQLNILAKGFIPSVLQYRDIFLLFSCPGAMKHIYICPCESGCGQNNILNLKL